VKTAGDYALLHANGTPFAEIVQMIRDEQAQYLRTQGTQEDYKILGIDGIDGTSTYSIWKVVTSAEEADDGR
jgi:hypothetical protein